MKSGLILASAAIFGAMTGVASAAIQTDYTVVPPGNLFPPETLAVVTNSNEFRGDMAWGDYIAPGGAPFYLINGATTADQRVLYWTANLTAGVTYNYSFSAVNNYPVAPPVLQLSDNGVLVGAGVAIAPAGPYGSSYTGGVVGPWMSYTLSFTPTSSGPATIGIVDTDLAFSGNDFSLSAVPEPATWTMLLAGFLGLAFAGYRGATTRRDAVAL